MTKGHFPEYHKTLLDPATFPAARKRIKFAQTPLSYLYRTGEFLYKIRKNNPIYSSLAVKEAYTHAALTLGRRWAPEIYHEVVPIVRRGEGFALGGPGEPVDYALKLTQLSDHYWLDYLLAHGKFNTTAAARVGRYLAGRHADLALPDTAEPGRPGRFPALVEEVTYQVKKYVNVTLTQPMLDMITRPLERALEEARRLFARRQKRGRIVEGHGEFTPEHIYVRGKEVLAISPLDTQHKFRVLDAANDVAALEMELRRWGAEECAERFVQRYISVSHDRELTAVLPAYRTFQALRSGLKLSEGIVEGSATSEAGAEARERAHAYFNLAVQLAREIPR